MVTLRVYFIEKKKTDLELQCEHLLLKFYSVDYVLDGKLTNRWAKNRLSQELNHSTFLDSN